MLIRELVINRETTPRGFADTFIFEPETEREKRYGKLLIAGEITEECKQARALVEGIAEIVQKQYYKGLERGILPNLESALNRTNEILAEIAEEGVASWINHIHFVIAVATHDELHIATTGNADALLIRHGDIASIKGNSAVHSENEKYLKTFANVASGRLYQDDRIFLVTPGIYQFFSLEKILRAIDRYSCGDAIKNFQSNLFEYKSTLTLAGLLMDLRAEKKEAIKPVVPVTLEPTGPVEEPEVIHTPRDWKTAAAGWLKKTTNTTKELATQGAKRLKGLYVPGMGKQSRLARWFEPFTNWFRRLPLKRKILFSAVCVLVLIFTITTIRAVSRQKQPADAVSDIPTAESIEQLLNDAEAALIYNDDSRVNVLLTTASEDLATAQKANKKDETLANLATRLTEIRKKTEKTTAVTLESVADYSDVLGTPGLIISMAKSPNGLYALDANARRALVVNPASKEISVVALPGNADPILGNVIKNGDILVLTSQPNLLRISDQTVTTAKESFTTNKVINASTLVSYGNNLYALVPAENSIYLYAQTSAGYGNEESWIKDASVNVQNALSFAIDGAIYVLKGNNEIIKLLKGAPQDFTLGTIPSVKHLVQLQTYEGWNNLYAFDRESNAIIVLDKQGALKKRYQWENFSAKLMYVDEPGSTAYVASDTEIKSFGL